MASLRRRTSVQDITMDQRMLGDVDVAGDPSPTTQLPPLPGTPIAAVAEAELVEVDCGCCTLSFKKHGALPGRLSALGRLDIRSSGPTVLSCFTRQATLSPSGRAPEVEKFREAIHRILRMDVNFVMVCDFREAAPRATLAEAIASLAPCGDFGAKWVGRLKSAAVLVKDNLFAAAAAGSVAGFVQACGLGCPLVVCHGEEAALEFFSCARNAPGAEALGTPDRATGAVTAAMLQLTPGAHAGAGEVADGSNTPFVSVVDVREPPAQAAKPTQRPKPMMPSPTPRHQPGRWPSPSQPSSRSPAASAAPCRCCLASLAPLRSSAAAARPAAAAAGGSSTVKRGGRSSAAPYAEAHTFHMLPNGDVRVIQSPPRDLVQFAGPGGKQAEADGEAIKLFSSGSALSRSGDLGVAVVGAAAAATLAILRFDCPRETLLQLMGASFHVGELVVDAEAASRRVDLAKDVGRASHRSKASSEEFDRSGSWCFAGLQMIFYRLAQCAFGVLHRPASPRPVVAA